MIALTLTMQGFICMPEMCLLVHHKAAANVRAIQPSVLLAHLQETRQRKHREAEAKERKKAEAAAKKDGPAKVDGTATPGEGQTPPGEEDGDANDEEDGDDKNEGAWSPSNSASVPLGSRPGWFCREHCGALALWPGMGGLRPS